MMQHYLRIWRYDKECRRLHVPVLSTALLPAAHVGAKSGDYAAQYIVRNTKQRTEAAAALLLRELQRKAPRFYAVALIVCPSRAIAARTTGPSLPTLTQYNAYLVSFAVLGPRNTIVHGHTLARTLALAQHYTQKYLLSVRAGQPDELLLARG
jgi:hypothetical protein